MKPPQISTPKNRKSMNEKKKKQRRGKNIRSRVVTWCISDFQLRVPHWPCWMSGNLAGGGTPVGK